ncbi:cytochrome P450 [Mycena belliarum]|uniref:Cytochrome P450 n=1 Tax=Mycena belliarum TaxID=1033014 RepID=A0AAD6TNX4_9AGAR|nr:cytochrome P450 [Mycena belliae]KAJ7065129.1 cytochrome P450 [Mycena belliae]
MNELEGTEVKFAVIADEFVKSSGTSTAGGRIKRHTTLYGRYTSPLRYIRGPKSTHLIMGNVMQLINGPAVSVQDQNHWSEEYGLTMKFHGFMNAWDLYSIDTKAIHHILSNAHLYPKPDAGRYNLSRIVGPGILVVEGDVHIQQNPAFGAPQVRELTSIFVQKSLQLRDLWAAQASQNSGVARVEVFSLLSKATLDIIGLAGAQTRVLPPAISINLFQDSTTTSTPLARKAKKSPMSSLRLSRRSSTPRLTQMGPFRSLQGLYPLLRYIPTNTDRIGRAAQATMMRIGRRLLAASKREIAETGTFETGRARDLLNLLVRANTSKEIPAHQRLSDEDVLAQVPTFLVAGHETTSTGLTWALFALTQNVAAQTRLREELLSLDTESPTLEELNSLQYLDCVVRETLRVHSPVIASVRQALQDDVIPLAQPVTDMHGEVHESLRIVKGTRIWVPIRNMNREPEIWGADANEFIPERWESPISTSIPGVWGNMLTFLGGPRNCIGYRFALAEMKAILFTLIRGFEFELAVPISDIGKKSTSVTQGPVLLNDVKAGPQLPLIVRPVVRP